MAEACDRCGATLLVAVFIPGHQHVEAVVCLRCGEVQPGAGATRRVNQA